ncbi:MAG: TetR/AcrR family transcriptional regulator [bacterium]|nr:TetR/AcrR family transcriptional regulator [bacterium]MCP5068261.1 TetR/AcrR family transcriptional regulator [bacterium]
MNSEPHFQWIRPVQQARSQQTLERLLDSAEALIADKGFDDITVAEIASRADCSVGAVYSRFRDKQGVLHSLQDRFVDEATLTAAMTLDLDRWQGASLEEIICELVGFLVEIHRERRGVLRELSVRSMSDVAMTERKARLATHIGQHVEALLLAQSDRIGHPDPATAVRFGLGFVFATLEQVILFEETGAYGGPTSDEQLARELSRAYLAYLDLNDWPSTSTTAYATD